MRKLFPALAAILVLPGTAPAAAASVKPPTLKAKSAILIDAQTGTVLYEKNPDEERPVASTQKLLTALLVAEAGDLDEEVTIRKEDTLAEPTKLYVKPGDSYTRRDLLAALLVKSPNDVALALARDNAGSVEAFAEKMNKRAFTLGADHSHFVNPNGLPAPEQHSTARDIAKIAREAYLTPEVRSFIALKNLTFQLADGTSLKLRNTNRVLHSREFCDGMKTGYTHAAGHCLVASGTANGLTVIAVVLGSSKAYVWSEAEKLLRYGLGLPAEPPSKVSKAKSSKKASKKPSSS